MMKLVEEGTGSGYLVRNGEVIRPATYRIHRYQGFSEGSGLPIPGFFKIEGAVDVANAAELVGASLTLRLEDGRALAVTIVDESGRVLSEGHGPSRCLCC